MWKSVLQAELIYEYALWVKSWVLWIRLELEFEIKVRNDNVYVNK